MKIQKLGLLAKNIHGVNKKWLQECKDKECTFCYLPKEEQEAHRKEHGSDGPDTWCRPGNTSGCHDD